MTAAEFQEGLHALFDEALAVAIGEIEEWQMTLPSEFEKLIRVESFLDAGVQDAGLGLVLRIGSGDEFRIGITKVR